MSKTKKPPLMKDSLSTEAVTRLARCLKRGFPTLKENAFRRACEQGLEPLELKARVLHIVFQLQVFLPEDFLVARECVLRAVEGWDPGDSDDPLRSFAAWPLIDWVTHAGLAHPKEALEALEKMTAMFSAEFAIRPFIEQHPRVTMRTLKRWTRHSDPHVRRLVSEGTRPRLPWGPQLKSFMADPSPCLPLLEALKDDSSETVRRSVANHLNDISKDNPVQAIEVCQRWSKNASPERLKLMKHALRSLIKQGVPEALAVLGYSTQARVKADLKLSHTKLALGQKLGLEFRIVSTSNKSQRLVVDYAVHYCKANGHRARKVFKSNTLELGAEEMATWNKSQTFRDFSTRKHYAGLHTVELLVSGQSMAQQDFELHV